MNPGDWAWSTEHEAMLWSQFWISMGLTQGKVAYAKGLGEEMSFGTVEEGLSHPKVRVVGFVIDTVAPQLPVVPTPWLDAAFERR